MTQTIFANVSDLVPGAIVSRRGDVTQLAALLGQSSHALELRLGYEAGRLRLGWCLLLLEESVQLGEFIWGGSTECSGGTDPANVVEFNGESFRPQVADIKRAKIYDQTGGDAAKADALFDSFQAQQLHLLNDRQSPNRIAKVAPIIGHDQSKFWLRQYPDAPSRMGVPQWTLRVPKRFRVAAKVPAGRTYMGGAH